MPRLKFLILGGGAVVSEYYLPALELLGLARETTVIDTSSEALQRLQDRYPHVSFQRSDFSNFLKREVRRSEFGAAVVALPNGLHEEAVSRALAEGLHVMCEKPLAPTGKACLKLAELAESAGRVLAVNMVLRLAPGVVAMQEALRRGLLGELMEIDVEDGSPYGWLSESGAFFTKEGGGVLANIGVHHLDLLGNFVGNLTLTGYEDDWQGGVEANVLMRFKSEKGVPVQLKLSWTRFLGNRFVLRGKQGELVFDKNRLGSCFWRPADGRWVADLSPEEPFGGKGWASTLTSCFAEQLIRFMQSFGKEGVPIVTGRQVASAASIIEQAYAQRKVRSANRVASEPDDLTFPDPAPVVVTGGTGFVGTHLVERLYQCGFDQIVVPVRNYRTCVEVARFPVQLPRMDLLRYEEVKSVIQGARWVFHLAYGRDGKRPDRVTIEGTRNVVEAAVAAGCEAVVVLSTALVFGHPHGEAVDESWPCRPPRQAYATSKAQMEKWCLQRARSSPKTRIVVLNPSCVYGPGGKVFSRMPLEMAAEGTFCWIEEGRGVANVTYVGNLVDAICRAAVCPQAHGERFIVTDGTLTWRDFLGPLLGPRSDLLPSFTRSELTALYKKSSKMGFRAFLRVLASDAALIEAVKKTRFGAFLFKSAEVCAPKWIRNIRQWREPQQGRPAVSEENGVPPPVWLADLFGPTSTVFSSQKAERLLSWKPRIDISSGQRLTAEWLRDEGLL